MSHTRATVKDAQFRRVDMSPTLGHDDPVTEGPQRYIALKIAEEIQRQGKTHQEAADLLALDRSAMSYKLRGKRPLTTEQLMKLAEWLDVPAAQWLPDPVDAS